MFGTLCFRCSVLPGDARACSDEQFVVENGEGEYDSYAVPETDTLWWNVVGSTGGRLVEAYQDASSALYRLNEHHRAFFFESDLSGSGAGAGSAALLMPPNPPGLLASKDIPEPDRWRYARIYDVGACSYTASWQMLATNLGIQILDELGDTDVIDDASHDGTTVEPLLRGEPRYPESLPLGPELPIDELVITSSFSGTGPSPCGDITVETTMRLRLQPTIGFNVTSATQTADEIMDQVACVPESPDWYTCTLPGDSDPFALKTESWYVDPAGDPDNHDRIRHVHCRVSRDQYTCYVPAYSLYPNASAFAVGTTARPVDYVARSVDLLLEPVSSSTEIDGCSFLGELAENKVDRQLRSRVRNLDLGPVLEVIAGDSAIDDFGIAPADLPTCGGGTDEECWARSFMGNRRHGCVDRAEGRLCDRFRLEPRRIQIKPDGLEIVLAENPGDPQAGLLAGIDGPLPGDEPLCDPWRGQDLDETDVPFETAVERATTPAALNGRLCGHDEVGCTAICPQFNTRCNDAVLLGAVRPEDAPPTGSRCFHGQCCPPSEACGGHCVDLESDDANCGSCGNACELGAHCEGGVCVVP